MDFNNKYNNKCGIGLSYYSEKKCSHSFKIINKNKYNIKAVLALP